MKPPSAPMEPPLAGTIDRWAWDYVLSTDLATKLAPPAPPEAFEPSPPPRRLVRPGRPAALEVSDKAPRVRRLGSPRGRARLLATFLHHELQAAELMCWALLAFPDTPQALREGLVRVCRDEVRHMALYAGHLEALGFRVGEFPVRDWFWERVPACRSAAEFMAVMGLGFEAGNLEHASRFAARFRAVGDEEGARVQEQVQREELPHVRFAAHWFRELAGPLTFEAWRAHLPPPLSPMLMRGAPIDVEARLRAGMPVDFVEALEAWQPEPSGS